MRATVSRTRRELEGTIVYLASSTGRLVGCWADYSAEPEVGASVSVEIDLEAFVEVFHEVDTIRPIGFSLSGDDVASICGDVEDLDTDGLIYLRLSEDCLIMIEGRPGIASKGSRVRLDVSYRDLKVTPQ